jgi:hypothetical protein
MLRSISAVSGSAGSCCVVRRPVRPRTGLVRRGRTARTVRAGRWDQRQHAEIVLRDHLATWRLSHARLLRNSRVRRRARTKGDARRHRERLRRRARSERGVALGRPGIQRRRGILGVALVFARYRLGVGHGRRIGRRVVHHVGRLVQRVLPPRQPARHHHVRRVGTAVVRQLLLAQVTCLAQIRQRRPVIAPCPRHLGGSEPALRLLGGVGRELAGQLRGATHVAGRQGGRHGSDLHRNVVRVALQQFLGDRHRRAGLLLRLVDPGERHVQRRIRRVLLQARPQFA